jgi:ABC-type lipoprotein export system ATPase subunit
MIQLKKIYINITTSSCLGFDLHIKKGEIVSIVGASALEKPPYCKIHGTLDKLLLVRLCCASMMNILTMNDKIYQNFN